MLQKPIQGINAVITAGSTVYAHLEPDFDTSDLTLVHKTGDMRFDPCTIVLSKRHDFREDLNLDVKTGGNTDRPISGPIDISINRLTDWYVPGFQTLQIALNRSDPPYRITFPRQIEITEITGPLSFRTRLAIHRARARLVIDFTDLETRQTETHHVPFDPAFAGGTASVNFQDVEVAAPLGMSSLGVQVSVDYLGCTEKASPFPPYLFLFDTHLREEGSDHGLSESLSVLEDLNGHWARAKSNFDLEGYDCFSIRSGMQSSVLLTAAIATAKDFFDEDYYRKRNDEVDFNSIDPLTHYFQTGWKEGRNPNPDFSIREYLLRNPDVDVAGTEPLTHYANIGQKERRSLGTFGEKVNEVWGRAGTPLPTQDAATIFRRAQDMMVPMSLIDRRKIVVLVIPEHDAMSGGIYSIFSIADQLRRTQARHGYGVLVMTRPNSKGLTYIRNSAFKNSETVLRLEQLCLFSEVTDLQIHIPEYACGEFVRSLSPELLHYILRRDSVHINILNQNTRLMPEPHVFRDLRRIADTIGQSVSHHAFFGQDFADHYQLPTVLLPAYTDLSAYPASTFSEKENIIIYSDDEAPYRREVLKRLKGLKEYRLVKIKDMTFDTYMDLATRCKFSVSFGEGFDGYVAQPMYQGGIGFALYNDEFFPDPSYTSFENFFGSEDEMIDQIVPTIRRLESDKKRYEVLNRALRAKWDALYSLEDYQTRIGRLVLKDYEIYPGRTVAR